MRNGRILITGPLGHIGSMFIHNIRPGDFREVVLLDNLSTQRYCSLFHLPEGVPYRFIEADICEADLESLCKGVDVVLHLAAITDASSSFEISEKVDRVNNEGTRKVAKACALNGSRLIFLSTTSVYGTQQSMVDENCGDENLKCQSPYAESKLKAEKYLHGMGISDGLNYIICRFGTIFGTSIGMRFHTAINKFCWQACTGQAITVWKTALHQKRPYLDLNDAVRALNFIIKTDRFDNQVYNVLTANATVGEIVDSITKFVPDSRIEFVDARVMNQLSYEVSREKFLALGFAFQGNVSKGIRKTVNLIRGVRQIDGKAHAKF